MYNYSAHTAVRLKVPSLFVHVRYEKYNMVFQTSSVIKYICYSGKAAGREPEPLD